MKKTTLTKKVESSPFDDYKNKVNYDYILKASLPIKFTSKEYGTPYQEQIEEAYPELEEQIESLLTNEDYMKEDWEDVGLGRVYAKLDDIDDSIDITFGVSIKEAEKPFTLEDLIDYAKEFMWVLDSNTDEVSIYGVTIPGTIDYDDNIDDSQTLEPDYIHFKPTIKSSKDVKVEVIKEPSEKKDESLATKTEELDLNMLDKMLVQNNELHFKDENTGSEIMYKLNDDGVIEIYVDNKLVNSLPFSRLAVQRECKKTLQEGFKLVEEESDSLDLDLSKTKQNLEQGIEKVDELQDLKDELADKVDTLVNEDYQSTEFPSTEFTKQLIDPMSLDKIDLQNNLTNDQKLWITNNICSIDEIISGLYDLFNIINITEPVISLDTYITESYKILNKEDTKNGK